MTSLADAITVNEKHFSGKIATAVIILFYKIILIFYLERMSIIFYNTCNAKSMQLSA